MKKTNNVEIDEEQCYNKIVSLIKNHGMTQILDSLIRYLNGLPEKKRYEVLLTTNLRKTKKDYENRYGTKTE